MTRINRLATRTNITFAANPVAPYDPPYIASFDVSHRIHVRGHIWLNDDITSIDIPFKIANPGFSFDPTGPMFTSVNKNTLDHFDPCGGAFDPPVLSSGNTVLTFAYKAVSNHMVYYYLFNIVCPGYRFVVDPIIVNR